MSIRVTHKWSRKASNMIRRHSTTLVHSISFQFSRYENGRRDFHVFMIKQLIPYGIVNKTSISQLKPYVLIRYSHYYRDGQMNHMTAIDFDEVRKHYGSYKQVKKTWTRPMTASSKKTKDYLSELDKQLIQQHFPNYDLNALT